jgi:hypothetical protein
VLILGLLVVITGQNGFRENFNRLSGAEYEAIVQAGREADALFNVGFIATPYPA